MVQGCTLPTEYAPKFKTTINTELLPPARGDISPMTLKTLSPNKQAAPVTQQAGTKVLCQRTPHSAAAAGLRLMHANQSHKEVSYTYYSHNIK